MTAPIAPPTKARAMIAPRPRDLAYATLIVAVAAGVAWILRNVLGETAPAMFFITAVLISAVQRGFWPGLFSAALAFFLLNFLFAAPHFTLFVTHPQDLVTLAAFLLVAGLTGLMTGRLREQRDAAEGRAAVLTVLSEVSADLIRADRPETVLQAALTHLGRVAGGPAMILTRDGDQGLALLAASPEGLQPTGSDLQAADGALRHSRIEYAAARGWNGSPFTFVPLNSGQTTLHVLGHQRLDTSLADLSYREEAIGVIRHQTEMALQRLAFAETAEAERQRAEASGQRAALLASLSHDLRTPLATILGSVTTLRDLGRALPPEAQQDLLSAASEEAERLSQYVTNLLQMTRLELGGTLRTAWVDAADIARDAIERVTRITPQAVIDTDLPEDLPMIRAEAALLEQGLINLLENAVKYSDGPILLSGRVEGDTLSLSIADRGPGLPQPLTDWLHGDTLHAAPGSRGLGLPISKGIARTLGGHLSASTRDGGGAILTISLPLAASSTTDA